MNWGFVVSSVVVVSWLFGAYCVIRWFRRKGPLLALGMHERVGISITAATCIGLIYVHNGQTMLGLLFVTAILAGGITDARFTSKRMKSGTPVEEQP